MLFFVEAKQAANAILPNILCGSAVAIDVKFEIVKPISFQRR
jgi:hypothetical protein